MIGYHLHLIREIVIGHNQVFGSIGSHTPYSPPDANQGDGFGYSVDMDGNYAVIGSPFHNGNTGRVHVMSRNGFGFWNVEAILLSNVPNFGDKFGYSVSISGNRLVVGAPEGNANFGYAVVFKKNNGTWSVENTIYPTNNYHLRMGHDVDLDGDKMLISAPYGNLSGGLNHGLVWSYTYTSPSVYSLGFLYPLNPTYIGNAFGHSITRSGDQIVVTAPFSDPGTMVNHDSVIVYKETATNNFERIQAFSGATYNCEFGYAVSIFGNVMVIGARKDDGTPLDDRGKAYIYELFPSGLWNNTSVITGRDVGGNYGQSVASSFISHMAASQYTNSLPTPGIDIIRKRTTIFSPYVNVTDPMATPGNERVNEVSISNNFFIIGIPEGISENGNAGGRVFFGKIQ
ncbi:MAG: FG-GAP repeat protein [Saprospiraceae bacterium]|nr:FG-GAP repeat protein [Saprospiraceae bacterium]